MIGRWYVNWLLDRLDEVDNKLKRFTAWYDGTELNEYTEGWLGHLERRITELHTKHDGLRRRINRWM